MSTAVCMFVGTLAMDDFESELRLSSCTGTAIGDLGRHTKIGPDGMPIVDHRTVVFMQVDQAPAFIFLG